MTEHENHVINGIMQLKELALEIAQAEIAAGACEQDENNAGPFVEKYLHGLAEPPANWCAGFVSWCFNEACICLRDKYGALSMPFNYSLSARAIYNEFRRNGKIVDVPAIGDLVFFWRGSKNSWMGHVGIVYDIDLDTDMLITIEGNNGKFPAKVNYYYYKFSAVPQLLGYGDLSERE